MTENPLVSVIINCYNGEKYLREAIDSVIAQTYENWELVFWDNQSTDSTREIVESYKNPKIKYFYAHEHTSLGVARNLALENAEGDYIGFLDADDQWLNTFLDEYVNTIKINPDAVLVYSNYYCQEGNKKWIAYKNKESGRMNAKVFIKKYNIAISAALFKSSIIRNECVSFNENFSLIEDYDFFVKVSMFGNVIFISSPLMIYRYHENNLSHSLKWGDEFKLLIRTIDDNKDIYKKFSCYKSIIQKRANYVEANHYILAGQKYKAQKIIFKNILFSPEFIVLAIKILIGPEIMRKFHIRNQKV